jgi:hypothetical protein
MSEDHDQRREVESLLDELRALTRARELTAELRALCQQSAAPRAVELAAQLDSILAGLSLAVVGRVDASSSIRAGEDAVQRLAGWSSRCVGTARRAERRP